MIAGGGPSGTVTFLFTDIEGSTREWERDPDGMAALLEQHDGLMRGLVAAHKGRVFATGGDGFAVAFRRAVDGLDCAAEAQRLLREQGCPPVRMALHTGEALERDGDYFGPTVNRAARLMGVGHGGQVLVSAATALLAPRAAMRDLGEHRLRDLSTPERVFQLLGEGLVSEFPSLRSVQASDTNLPVQLTSFVGRAAEMDQLGELLARERLVTVTGVGGVGKTRLAAQIAADQLPRHRDGAWMCELASADDGEAMIDIVAQALRAPARPGLSLQESVIEFLRAREMLLLLDNCEHLIASVSEFVEFVLRTCPTVYLLATSREGLGVSGEQLWPLRSLATPALGTNAEEIARSDAVRLFVDRAVAVDPTYTLTGEDAAAVGEICRRLDGIALAIELAAARVAALSPAEIAALLDERFRLLTGGRRRAVERHHTLRATVDWSYSLLEPARQLVFDRFGVFAGGFDARAAQAVASDDEHVGPFDVLDALDELAGKSMVVVERPGGGSTRYSLLETLRQYALERLDEHAATDATRRRHAQHYAQIAAQMGPALLTADEIDWRRRLRLELDNFRTAVGWAIEFDPSGDGELGLRILAALAREVVLDRGSGIGGWATRAIEATQHAASVFRPAVVVSAAYDAYHRGDLDAAEQLAFEAYAQTRESDPGFAAWAQMARSNIAASRGELNDALALLDDVARWLPPSNIYDQHTVHSIIALYTVLTGNTEKAVTAAAIGLDAARTLAQPSALALATYANGMVLAERGADDDARAYCHDSIQLTEQGASDVVYANALGTLALIALRHGETYDALDYVRTSIAHAYSIGDRPPMVGTLHTAARLLAPLIEPTLLATIAGGILDGWFEPMSHIIPRCDRLSDETLEPASRVLGTDLYNAARRRGASMSYEQFVSLVLEQLDLALQEAASIRSGSL